MDAYKVQIRKLIHDPLAKNSTVVFAGSMAANVLSYLYHLVMGRILGPAGYGELSSLLSLLYVFTVPLLVVQTVLVKFLSGFKANGNPGQAKSLFLRATKWSLVVSLILLPVVYVFTPWVTAFLRLSNPILLMSVYILLVISLLTSVAASMLTGYQLFWWLSGLGAAAVFVKLIASIPLSVWRVPGVMLGSVLAALVTYAVYFIPLRKFLSVREKSLALRTRDAVSFAVPTFLTQLGVTSLYSTDIILVRHFFDPKSSGLYAALAILGKIIFYASSAVPIVLFPVAAERTVKGADTKKLIVTAVSAVAAISAGITAAYFLFPAVIVRLLFGSAYAGADGLLGVFGIFLSLYSLGSIIATACLAIGKLSVWIFAVISALVQIFAISFFHATIRGVIWINIGVSAFFVLAAGVYYLTNSHEKV